MINFAPFISLLLRKKKTTEPKKLSENDKKELAKINEMGMFEAMDYLANKKDTGAGFQGEDRGDGLSGFRG